MLNKLLILITLLSSEIYAQHYPPDSLYTQGNQKITEANYEEAIHFFDRASDLFKQEKRWADYAASRNNIIRINIAQYSFDLPSQELPTLLELVKDKLEPNSFALANTYRNMGMYEFLHQGNYNKCSEYLEKVIDILGTKEVVDSLDLAETLHYAGWSDWNRGDLSNAFKKTKQSLDIHLRFNDQFTGTIYTQLGNIYWTQGDYDSALINYNYGLKYNSHFLGASSYATAWDYNNIGYVYDARNQLNRALSYFEKAKIIRSKIHTVDNPELADSYTNLAMIHFKLGNNKKAIENNYQALEIKKATLDSNNPNIATTLSNLIAPLVAAGRYIEARSCFNEAHNIYLKNPNGHYLYVTNLFLNQSILYQALGKEDSAMYALKKALAHTKENMELPGTDYKIYTTFGNFFLKSQDFEDAVHYYDQVINSYTKNPGIYHSPRFLLKAMTGKCKAQTAVFQPGVSKHRFIENAFENISLGKKLISFLEKEAKNREDRYILSESIHAFYAASIDFCYTIYQTTNTPALLDSMFSFMQTSKGVSLRFINNERISRSSTYIPDSLLTIERHILDHVNKAFTRYFNEPDSLTLKVMGLREQHNKLITHLEQRYPKYHALKYNHKYIGLSEVQRNLNFDELVLEFLVTPEYTYCFKISGSNIGFRKIEIKEDSLRKGLESFSKLLGNYQSNSPSYWQQYHDHSSWILNSILNLKTGLTGYKKIFIFPDGPLESIPYGLLAIGSSAQEPNEYLLNHSSISYAYSANNFFRDDYASKNQWEKPLIAFAPRGFSPRDTLSYNISRDLEVELKWNESEAILLSKMMNGEAIVGEQATETAFKNNIQNSRIIHLATHAFFDVESPPYSKLTFAKNDTLEDGYLHAFELYNLEIEAELAVLSACNTGIGKERKGEGGLSLANAFAYAGVPSVVVTKWQVDDLSTSELMKLFYKYLKNGSSKSEALQLAKLKFLKTAPPAKRHPFYWGAFVLIGDDSPIIPSHYYWVWILLVTLLLFTCILFGTGHLRKLL